MRASALASALPSLRIAELRLALWSTLLDREFVSPRRSVHLSRKHGRLGVQQGYSSAADKADPLESAEMTSVVLSPEHRLRECPCAVQFVVPFADHLPERWCLLRRELVRVPSQVPDHVLAVSSSLAGLNRFSCS